MVRKYNSTQELELVKKMNLELTRHETAQQSTVNEHKQGPERYVTIKQNEKDLILARNTIVRVEADENYCHLHLSPESDPKQNHHLLRITFREMLDTLDDQAFVKTHRSHAVNRSYTSHIEKSSRDYQVILSNGDIVPVSRSHIKSLRERIYRQPV